MCQYIPATRSYPHLDHRGRVYAKDIDHFHTNLVLALLGILPAGVSACFERAILASAEILPVMLERLAFAPGKVDRPEVDEVERRLNRPFAQRGHFFLGRFGQRWRKASQLYLHLVTVRYRSRLQVARLEELRFVAIWLHDLAWNIFKANGQPCLGLDQLLLERKLHLELPGQAVQLARASGPRCFRRRTKIVEGEDSVDLIDVD